MFTHPHITVLLAACSTGEIAPPYLLFPGDNISDIPHNAVGSKDVWGNFFENGWMDKDCFLAWMTNFCEWNDKWELPSQGEWTLLQVDGHHSQFQEDALFTAACHRVVVLCGPSNLTSSWQANDSGTNKAFKSNLSVELSKWNGANLTLASADVVSMILNALKMENMPKVIQNSFEHVGVSPFDHS